MLVTPQLASSRITPVILCGGAGKRLFPLSTRELPKQFLPLLGGNHSMLQHTLARFESDLFLTPAIVTQSVYLKLVHHQSASMHPQIILEDVAQGNALAAAYAALCLAPDALLLIAPADHAIDNVRAFQQTLRHAAATLPVDAIATFHVAPTHGSVEYGYIKRSAQQSPSGAYHIEHFCEKPDALTASHYYGHGLYRWNSGMFLCRAATYLDALQRHAPAIFATACRTYAMATRMDTLIRIPKPVLPCPDLSIDYAIMEHVTHAVTYPLECGWSDIGSWQALKHWHYGEATCQTELRPWGNYEWLYHQDDCKVKRMHILPKQQLSLQSHQHRSEHWWIEHGEALVTIDDTVHHLHAGDDIIIPQGMIHRATNPSAAPLAIIEVQRGNLICESDIIRYS
jgi:mannose-1-phosphate guanylyltransferase/mannose-6-phosphate isomerase